MKLKLFLNCFRLLVNLTQPAVLCFKEMKERKDSEIMKSYLEVVKCLQDYKEVCYLFCSLCFALVAHRTLSYTMNAWMLGCLDAHSHRGRRLSHYKEML